MVEKLSSERTDRKGVAKGYASLGDDGLVPATQLPSSQGTGAPVNASYVTISAEAGLSNETLFATALDTYPHNIGGVAHSGTLDGNQLPAMSASKKGAVPAVGTATGAFLSSEGTWGVAGGGDMFKSTYDPNADGTIALAQLDPLVCSEAEAGTLIATHAAVTISVHNFDATGYAFPQAHAIGGTAHSGLIGTLIPTVNLGGAGASGTNYLRGDQTWQVPAGGTGGTLEVHTLSGTAHTGTLSDTQHGNRSVSAGTFHGVAQIAGAESTANKGISGGYAGLTGTLVPTINLGGVGAGATLFLRGDQTWAIPAGGGTGGDMYKATYDPNADGVIALAQLDTLVCSEAEADGKITTHGAVTVSVHNFDATGYAFPQAHTIGGTAHSGTLNDTFHGTRGASLHSDSHAQIHTLDGTAHTGTLSDTQHGIRTLANAHALSAMSGTITDAQHGTRDSGIMHLVAQVSGAESTANKGISGGYAGLTGTLVPTVNLGGAGATASNYLRGDQTWQIIPGGGTAVSFYIPGTALILSNDAEISWNSFLSKVKECRVSIGTFTVAFDARITEELYDGTAQLYRDGTAIGTLRTITSTSYNTYSENIGNFLVGGLCQIYARAVNASYPIYLRNFRISGTGESAFKVIL